jgi:hypothetical protein
VPGIIQKRLWLNAALILLAIALAALLWLEPGKTPADKNSISTLDKASVTRILIEVDKRPSTLLEKQESGWRIRLPLDIAANHLRVNNILNLLSTQSISHYTSEGMDLAEFGLLPPRATIHFDAEVFSFGDIDPLGHRRYLLNRDTLFLIEDLAYPLITANIGGLVNPRLLPENGTINTFELPGLKVFRTESGGWDISPGNSQLAADDLQTWVDEWSNAQSTYIEYLPHKVINNGKSALIQFQNGELVDYRIIRDEHESALFRTDAKLKYTLNAALLETLIAAPTPIKTLPTEKTTYPQIDTD